MPALPVPQLPREREYKDCLVCDQVKHCRSRIDNCLPVKCEAIQQRDVMLVAHLVGAPDKMVKFIEATDHAVEVMEGFRDGLNNKDRSSKVKCGELRDAYGLGLKIGNKARVNFLTE
jgi:hypothetical protein